MRYQWEYGFAAICVILAPACTSTDAVPQAESTFLEPPASTVEDTLANSEAPVVDVSFKYECKIFGKREENRYPMNGKEPGRIEFDAQPIGRFTRGGARITQQDTDAVVVRWWCDLKSGIQYSLRVWAKQ